MSQTKIGVINVQVAITSTAEGKQAAAELQSRFAPRQTELDNIRKQIDERQTKLRTGQTTLSDEEQARLAREGDQMTRAYQRKQQESQDDFNDAQQELVNRIGRKIVTNVEYARSEVAAEAIHVFRPVGFAATDRPVVDGVRPGVMGLQGQAAGETPF